MIGKSAILAGALAAACLAGPAASAAPDPYSPSADTRCRVAVPAVVEPGRRVVVRASVTANSSTSPTGKVAVTIRAAGGAVVWTKTADYNGGTLRLVGPVLDEGGKYSVVSKFTPDDSSSFAGCRGSLGFAVDTEGDTTPPDDDGDGDDGIGGLLPDTGGPDLLWLLLGVGLVGGGAGAVVYSRRQRASAGSPSSA